MLQHFLRLRRRTNALFDMRLPPTRASRGVAIFLAGLIMVNVAAVILETVESIRAAHTMLLAAIEQVATAVFALEYILRVWSSVERSSGLYRHPLFGRLRYAARPMVIIDLIAVLPALLGLLVGADLRLLRLVRLVRLLKLTRYSATLTLLWAVFIDEARVILSVLVLLLMMVIFSSCLMYILENDAQPKAFGSIPAAMWWSVETITTVGYGDVVPRTVLGKCVGGIVAILGIGTVALFSGVITVSFMEQLRQRREQYRRLVESGLHSGRFSAVGAAEIERLGTELGVGPAEAHEIVDEALHATPARHYCPHCGHDLLGAGDKTEA